MNDFAKNIKFVGNGNTNYSSRRGYLPLLIVNHRSQGDVSSVLDWFTTEKNKISSCHFFVSKKGVVYQFVEIEYNAWCNGLNESETYRHGNSVIAEYRVNPNWISVSIEHEILEHEDGGLTSEQLQATINLHKYIISYAKEKMDSDIIPDSEHILGHKDVDPVEKYYCPGEKFPISNIIQALQGIEFSDIRGHWCEGLIRKGAIDGWIKGYPDGTFRPDEPITRAEVVAMLSNFLK
jgi:N-acetyl-anhydromuramyl-L-alanine amidase AmpD